MNKQAVYHLIPGDGPNPLVQAISRTEKFQVNIVSIYLHDQTVPNFCKANNIPFFTLGFRKKTTIGQFFVFLLFLFKKKPTLVFAHSFYPSLVCALSKFLFPKTIFVAVRHHNLVHVLSENKKAVLIDRFISNHTDHTVCVSDSVKETLLDQGCKPSQLSVIYNGLSIPKSKYSLRNLANFDRNFNLVAIGRIDWQKNYEDMLKIVATLRDLGISLRVKILGEGNHRYWNKLKQMQSQLRLENEVEWCGRKTDIYEILSQADIFIHTAIDEACPLVLIETMMYGIPVISSNLGGCKDVIANVYDGCDPRDTVEFAARIMEVLSNLSTYSEYALDKSEEIAARFNPETMQQKYTELATKLLHSARAN